MKILLVAMAAAFALAANAADSATSSPKQSADSSKKPKTCCQESKKSCCAANQTACCKAARRSQVTGSRVPVKVDKAGRPIDSTLKVIVVDERDVQVWGMGSPSDALSRLPMATIRGKR